MNEKEWKTVLLPFLTYSTLWVLEVTRDCVNVCVIHVWVRIWNGIYGCVCDMDRSRTAAHTVVDNARISLLVQTQQITYTFK